MHRAIRFLLTTTVLITAPASVLTAQDTVRPPATPSCAECRIVVSHMVTLGDEDGPGSFDSYPTAVVRDSRGRYIVASGDAPAEKLHLFDSDGRFLRRLGSNGEGPGEFRYPDGLVITRQDTLHVYDSQTGRHSVFDPALRFVRSDILSRYYTSVARFPDGSTVFAAAAGAGGMAGVLLHRYRSDGGYLDSFGDSAAARNDRLGYIKDTRRLAWSHGGGVWALEPAFRYRFALWSLDGTLQRVIEPASPWYAPHDLPLGPTPTRPPSPSTAAISEDRYGRVWVTGYVANPDWAKGLGSPIRGEGGGMIYPSDDFAQVWDGVIDVFDPVAGVLMATVRVEEPYAIFVTPEIVAGLRYSEAGAYQLEIASARLVRDAKAVRQ
ncbi:MAG: 6-bladed beta-propeller [Gemmatimonadota bacterium]